MRRAKLNLRVINQKKNHQLILKDRIKMGINRVNQRNLQLIINPKGR